VPEVAVVVPAHDAADLLPRALAAIAAQDVEHELVVVDDGSRDPTADVAGGARARGGGGREGQTRKSQQPRETVSAFFL